MSVEHGSFPWTGTGVSDLDGEVSDDRDQLAALIRAEYAKHPEGCRPAPRALAGAILRRFTVLDGPALGTRYAYRWSHDGVQRYSHFDNEGQAVAFALLMRAQQRRLGQPVNAVPVWAPIPPWIDLPFSEDVG